MSKQFKLGPTKTRGGDEVHIMDIHCGYIYARYLSGKRDPARWRFDGRQMIDSIAPYDIRRMHDLMPNVEPEKYTIEGHWSDRFFGTFDASDAPSLLLVKSLRGKRTRVEITVLDDEEHVCDHPDCEGNVS